MQRGFLSERKGKVIQRQWTENRKGAGTNSGESGARNLKAESIRSGAESTGGCVKLKTVTEIRRVWQSHACMDNRCNGLCVVFPHRPFYYFFNALLLLPGLV